MNICAECEHSDIYPCGGGVCCNVETDKYLDEIERDTEACDEFVQKVYDEDDFIY